MRALGINRVHRLNVKIHSVKFASQMAERLLPTPVGPGSNPPLSNEYKEHLLNVEITKIKKRGREWPIKKIIALR